MGGGAITRELHPGFHCPALTHDVLLWSGIAREMALERYGLQRLTPVTELFAPDADGTAITLRADAPAYGEFRRALGQGADVVGELLASPPPDIDAPGARDLWNLLAAGRAFRSLGRRDSYRLLRWLPMPAADFIGEWFDDGPLAAGLVARGLSGTLLGPRSGGSTLVLLLHEAHRRLAGGTWRARGGPGALTAAMAAAATKAGAEIRTGTTVERILVRDERVAGVIVDGEEIVASTVVSAIDPKTTFLDLVDPADLMPDFAMKMRNYRAAGTVAKVNVALSALPRFTGAVSPADLSGRIHIGPRLDTLERAFDHAKYGEISMTPWLDVQIPSILDPSLAPADAHVMSIYVHYAPFTLRGTTWRDQAPVLLDRVIDTLDQYAPGLRSLIVATEIITPERLQQAHGLWGGHIFHGELAPDQLFAMRPLLGHGRYATPVAGLYLCGAGTHPGGFLSGASGKLAASRLTNV